MAITRFHYLNTIVIITTLFQPVQNKDPLIFHYSVGFSVLIILRVKDQLSYTAIWVERHLLCRNESLVRLLIGVKWKISGLNTEQRDSHFPISEQEKLLLLCVFFYLCISQFQPCPVLPPTPEQLWDSYPPCQFHGWGFS